MGRLEGCYYFIFKRVDKKGIGSQFFCRVVGKNSAVQKSRIAYRAKTLSLMNQICRRAKTSYFSNAEVLNTHCLSTIEINILQFKVDGYPVFYLYKAN